MGQRNQVWELISSLSLWFTWHVLCTRVFEGRQEPLAETIWAIWLELVHTLWGHYSQLQPARSRRRFLFVWREGFLYTISRQGIRWQYRPPVWLFPPRIV